MKKRTCGPPRYFIGDRQVSEKEWKSEYTKRSRLAAQKKKRELKERATFGGHLPGCWPMRSAALSVHPKQIKQAVERAQKAGVPTDFHPSGDPIFRDRDHRRRYMREVEGGIYDRDGGYGDAQKGSSEHYRQTYNPWAGCDLVL